MLARFECSDFEKNSTKLVELEKLNEIGADLRKRGFPQIRDVLHYFVEFFYGNQIRKNMENKVFDDFYLVICPASVSSLPVWLFFTT